MKKTILFETSPYDWGEYKETVNTLWAKYEKNIHDPLMAAPNLSRLLSEIDKEKAEYILTETVFPQLLCVLSASNALASFFFRHPDFLLSLFPVIKETRAGFEERHQNSPPHCPHDGDALAVIRIFKTAEFIRITAADLLDWDDFETTVWKISRIADFCAEYSLRQMALEKDKVAVIAMGKWGGRELNYSSDIDLIYVCADGLSGETKSAIEEKIRASFRYIDECTSDGLVFRVDNKIRPEGASGPMVMDLSQYEKYYRERAMKWEFQALLKSRCSAGDKEVGEAFITMTRSIIFSRDLESADLLAAVREMKRKIENKLVLQRKEDRNVKLGAGGIRDIEFIVQYLQLHHGRFTASLDDPNTLSVLSRMNAQGILTGKEYARLKVDYIFLRRLEHMLQLRELQPVRQIPADPQTQLGLARKMGAVDASELMELYTSAVERTRRIFFEFFDLTIEFLQKRIEVRKAVGDDLKADAHFMRLESGYFMRFNAEEITAHIAMLSELNAGNVCRVRWKRVADAAIPMAEVTIAAEDYLGEFAVTCGLFSAHSLNIDSGETYTYLPLNASQSAADAYYRRPGRSYTQDHSLLGARKVITVLQVNAPFDDASLEKNLSLFTADLERMLSLLFTGDGEKVKEELTLRVLSVLKKSQPQKNIDERIQPIEFSIDNDSDRTYTLLDITSVDSFAFLYEFTSTLAGRNYYIGKVEIRTDLSFAHDRLFLTSADGKKITSPRQIADLKLTLSIIKQFTHFLAAAPDPMMALKQFSSLLDTLGEDFGAALQDMVAHGGTLEQMARVLGTSRFLVEDFLRVHHQDLLPLLLENTELERPVDAQACITEILKLCNGLTGEERIDALNRFKDRELFRADMRHLSGRVSQFNDFCMELTALADAVTACAVDFSIEEACIAEGISRQPAVCALFALGKWGGYEIGYASDIEVMFIYKSSQPLEDAAFYERAARELRRHIRSKKHGIFELDFRLRPDGEAGSLAVSIGRFSSYYQSEGSAANFERQALLRLRPACGDAQLISEISALRDKFVFSSLPFDTENMIHLRDRQSKELVEKDQINMKYSRGGLLDAEYAVQTLQVIYGAQWKDLRLTNTLHAVQALQARGLITAAESKVLEEGYRFLRALINALRIVRGNARDLTLPQWQSVEFEYLSRRLRSFKVLEENEEAQATILRHMSDVHSLFESLVRKAQSSSN